MIAIGAIVLNGAVVGEHSLIAAGAVVPENAVIPPGSLVMGVPGRPVKPVSDKQRADILEAAKSYVNLSRSYKSRSRSPGRRSIAKRRSRS